MRKTRLEAIEKGTASSHNKIKMDVLFDQSKFIEQASERSAATRSSAGALTCLSCSSSSRISAPTIIIGFSIPLSIIATFFVMYQLGIKLNIMSLGGLALGVGMLVDDAIVVLESVVRHFKMGKLLPQRPTRAQRKSDSQ